MTRIQQATIIANRYLAGVNDRETSEQIVRMLFEQDWHDVEPARIVLDLALELVRAEARAVAAERRQRAGN